MILGGDWTLTGLIKLNNKYCTSKCLKMGGPTEECSSPIEHIDTDRPTTVSTDAQLKDSVLHQFPTAPVQIRPIRFWKGIFMPSIQPGTSQPQLGSTTAGGNYSDIQQGSKVFAGA